MAIKISKFRSIVEAQHFLNGGILGARVQFPVPGLVGKTITFTAPGDSVTFTAGADASVPQGFLTYKDIKTQVEAQMSDIRVINIEGCVGFIHPTMASGIVMGATEETGKAALGFPIDTEVKGVAYAAPGGSAPAFITASVGNDGSHTIYTLES